jgi:hypothetical protein
MNELTLYQPPSRPWNTPNEVEGRAQHDVALARRRSAQRGHRLGRDQPGWLQTDMGGPGAPTAVAEGVCAVLREVDRATLADSGELLNWRGDRLAW